MTAGRPPSRSGHSDVLAAIEHARVVPLITMDDAAAAHPLADALTAAGLLVAEVAFRTPAAGEALRILAADPRLLVGAGTVLTADQAERAAANGAQFIVTPGFSATVIKRCVDLGVPVLPGIATASELQAACEIGLPQVKLFPAEALGGISLLRALAAPFPHVRFLPSGGITETNLASYLAQPEVLAVSGSWMVPGAAIRAGDFATVTHLASRARVIASTAARPSAPQAQARPAPARIPAGKENRDPPDHPPA